MKFLKDILTGPDGVTYDLVRVVTTLGALQGLSLQAFVVLARNQPFDFTAFGTGLGILVGAGAAGMWARRDVESVAPSVTQTTVTTVKE